MQEIAAIKHATQTHVEKIVDVALRSKDALLSGLVMEYIENMRQVDEIISNEKGIYLSGTRRQNPHE
jgi:hypothetical protein